jgi:hypothetical protein
MTHTRAVEGKVYTLEAGLRWVLRGERPVLQQFGTRDGIGIWIDVPFAVECQPSKVSRQDTLDDS